MGEKLKIIVTCALNDCSFGHKFVIMVNLCPGAVDTDEAKLIELMLKG